MFTMMNMEPRRSLIVSATAASARDATRPIQNGCDDRQEQL
jgi:hypothetical protein